jgi:PIN domain nuclease of toxin-antitoxin system
VSLGKYQIPGSFAEFISGQIAANQLTVLPVTVAHAAIVASLPFHHRDPFDRLLVAQTISESVPLVSADSDLDAYGISRVW